MSGSTLGRAIAKTAIFTAIGGGALIAACSDDSSPSSPSTPSNDAATSSATPDAASAPLDATGCAPRSVGPGTLRCGTGGPSTIYTLPCDVTIEAPDAGCGLSADTCTTLCGHGLVECFLSGPSCVDAGAVLTSPLTVECAPCES